MEIKLKEGKTTEDAVFEKTGITHEFTVGELDAFIGSLQDELAEKSQGLVQIDIQLEKTKKPEVELMKKEKMDFAMYLHFKSNIKVAMERILELDEAHPSFEDKIAKVTDIDSSRKYLTYSLQKEELDKEYELIQETLADYESTKAQALSCLE